jgi:hypothetical protein
MASRPVAGNGPPQRFTIMKRGEWGRKLDRARDDLKIGLDCYIINPADEARQLILVNALLELLELPSRDLLPLCGKTAASGTVRVEHHGKDREGFTLNLGALPKAPQQEAGGKNKSRWKVDWKNLKALAGTDLATMAGKAHNTTSRACSAIYRDRQDLALKFMTGLGVANPSAPVADMLGDMHLPREKELRLPTPTGE